jgi:protein-S-isoprenylcysteine O-methyltransferase Ste14
MPSQVPSSSVIFRGMEGLAAAVVAIAILLGVLLVVAFDLFCLARLAGRDDRSFLSKVVWAAAIVCVSPFGGLVYLLWATRLTPYAPRLGDGRPRRPRSLT